MNSLIIPDNLTGLMARLTPRQMEILYLLAQGKNASEIGKVLSISRATVKDHVRKACWKLGIDNRVQLIVIYAMWCATPNTE